MIRSFGSLLAFTLRFTYLGISQMQGFSLSNSLIKKLYSAEHPEDCDSEDDQESFLAQSSKKTDQVKDEIEKRETFSYQYNRFWCLWRFDKKCCCCLRPKKERGDFLFKSAKSKLSEELDILEIVKKLRVHQFAA